VRLEGLFEKSNDFIGNQTRDLPACSIVHQPSTLLHSSYLYNSFRGEGAFKSPVPVFVAITLDSVVGIATSYGLDDRGDGVRVPVGSRIFSSPHRPDLFGSSPNLLSNEYQGLFPRG
jgi:hypothetical protein